MWGASSLSIPPRPQISGMFFQGQPGIFLASQLTCILYIFSERLLSHRDPGSQRDSLDHSSAPVGSLLSRGFKVGLKQSWRKPCFCAMVDVQKGRRHWTALSVGCHLTALFGGLGCMILPGGHHHWMAALERSQASIGTLPYLRSYPLLSGSSGQRKLFP